MDAAERYAEVADDLAARHAEVELGQMMGMPALKAGGKMIGGFATGAGAMVFKLPEPAAREQALALPGAALFDPRGGRPMREWVQVPFEHEARWPALAEQALAQCTR